MRPFDVRLTRADGFLSGCLLVAVACHAIADGPDQQRRPAAGTRRDLSARASQIDPLAREHPEIGFVFADDKGKPMDLQHAVVDTRVPPQGKLVIWLMDHSQPLFERISSYGLHGIQVHYANRWFGGLKPEVRDSGDVLGRIRLEASTGEDASPLVEIPKPDGMAERARQFLLWLDNEHPEGRWAQFLTDERKDVRWEKVTMAGISHGATTAARFAVHKPVDRVVMLSGPRDNTETWQGIPSATPANRFFGFSHMLDSGWTADHARRSANAAGQAVIKPGRPAWRIAGKESRRLRSGLV